MTILKPCPFCGSINLSIMYASLSKVVICDTCQARGPSVYISNEHMGKAKVEENKWNARFLDKK